MLLVGYRFLKDKMIDVEIITITGHVTSVADPEWVKKSRSGMYIFGSDFKELRNIGIRDKHPGSATLQVTKKTSSYI